MLAVPQVEQGAEPGVGPEDHVPSVPSVPSVWAAVRDELLPPETHTAVPPVAGPDEDGDLIDKRHKNRIQNTEYRSQKKIKTIGFSSVFWLLTPVFFL